MACCRTLKGKRSARETNVVGKTPQARPPVTKRGTSRGVRVGASAWPATSVEVRKGVTGLRGDWVDARLLQLRPSVAARKQTNPQRARPLRRQEVPYAIAENDGAGDVDAEPVGRRKEQVRIRLRMRDVVAGNDDLRLDAEQLDRWSGGPHVAARRNRPGHVLPVEPREQVAGTGQRAHLP